MNKRKVAYILLVFSFFLIISGIIAIRKEDIYYKNLKEGFQEIQTNSSKQAFRKLDKKDIALDLNSYNDYLNTVDLINKYSVNGILLSSATSTNINEINRAYNKLNDKYKEILKTQVQDIKKQFEEMNNLQEEIANLFKNNNKTVVKDNVTIETIDNYILELNKIPQKDFVIENQFYLKNAKIEIKKKIEAAWVKLNVPYISQNKNNILNGCEAASMLMALQYKGYLKEMTLQEYVKLMPLSLNNNAEEGFTHDLYTLYPLTVPHWIAPTPLTKFGIDTSGNNNIINGTGMSIDELDRELDNNNPVIIYVIAKFNEPKEVIEGAPKNLHVMLLTGYNKITREHFIVDPWTHDDGRTSWTVSKELLEEKYTFVGKKAVIVR